MDNDELVELQRAAYILGRKAMPYFGLLSDVQAQEEAERMFPSKKKLRILKQGSWHYRYHPDTNSLYSCTNPALNCWIASWTREELKERYKLLGELLSLFGHPYED